MHLVSINLVPNIILQTLYLKQWPESDAINEQRLNSQHSSVVHVQLAGH
jgi:hypothetical protein